MHCCSYPLLLKKNYNRIYDKLRLLLLAGSGLDLVTSDLRVFLEV